MMEDLDLFHDGENYKSYEYFGSHKLKKTA